MAKRIGSIDYTPFVLIGGVGLLAYFFWGKLSGSLSSAANAGNNAAIDQSAASAVSSSIAQSVASGGTQSLGNAELSGLAAQAYNLGVSQTVLDSATQDKMVGLFTKLKTTLDLLTMEKYFGTKQATSSYFSSCNLLGTNCQAYDLPSWIALTLDPQHISAINGYFANVGINYFF